MRDSADHTLYSGQSKQESATRAAEHAAEAERLLEVYREQSNLTPYEGRPSNVWLAQLLQRAQVHATLATLATVWETDQ